MGNRKQLSVARTQQGTGTGARDDIGDVQSQISKGHFTILNLRFNLKEKKNGILEKSGSLEAGSEQLGKYKTEAGVHVGGDSREDPRGSEGQQGRDGEGSESEALRRQDLQDPGLLDVIQRRTEGPRMLPGSGSGNYVMVSFNEMRTRE